LTAQLVERLGAPAVSAIDPSAPFVAAIRARFPEVDVRPGVAEQLPFPDDCFDLALAQLVVHFMTDAVSGLAEMARVTRPGGLVAACVWDHAGGGSPLTTFWRAVHDTDPDARDEAELGGDLWPPSRGWCSPTASWNPSSGDPPKRSTAHHATEASGRWRYSLRICSRSMSACPQC
jgi:SAM-dependent methyltransferase